jgi:branched-chain amino acid aminotransferase
LTTTVSIDGTIFDEHSAKISVFDRGFLYGDSVYEVMRTYGGRPYALSEHLERLQRSAELLGIALPLAPSALAEEIRGLLGVAVNPESYIRAIVTRGAGPIGLDPALATHPRRVIIVMELQPLPAELYTRGVGIRLVSAGRIPDGALPSRAKSGNYLMNVMALGAARRRGAHEAILLDAAGRITEGASSNVFLVTRGRLSTPPLSAGILEGITRCKVIDLARREGLHLEERELWPEDLRGAEEIFLTGTLREILPVTRVDDEAVGEGVPGPATRHLQQLFRALIEEGARRDA